MSISNIHSVIGENSKQEVMGVTSTHTKRTRGIDILDTLDKPLNMQGWLDFFSQYDATIEKPKTYHEWVQWIMVLVEDSLKRGEAYNVLKIKFPDSKDREYQNYPDLCGIPIRIQNQKDVVVAIMNTMRPIDAVMMVADYIDNVPKTR